MAGSHPQAFPFSLSEDPILSARLETVKLLADRLSEHVVVIDRTLNVVYANESVWSGTSRPAPVAGNSNAMKSSWIVLHHAAFLRSGMVFGREHYTIQFGRC